jgi:hypothetical protein
VITLLDVFVSRTINYRKRLRRRQVQPAIPNLQQAKKVLLTDKTSRLRLPLMNLNRFSCTLLTEKPENNVGKPYQLTFIIQKSGAKSSVTVNAQLYLKDHRALYLQDFAERQYGDKYPSENGSGNGSSAKFKLYESDDDDKSDEIHNIFEMPRGRVWGVHTRLNLDGPI